MAITVNGTSGITFPDVTLQASAANLTAFASGAAGQPKNTLASFDGGTPTVSSGGYIMGIIAASTELNASTSSAPTTFTPDGVGLRSDIAGSTTLTKFFDLKMLIGGTFRVKFNIIQTYGTTQNINTRWYLNGVATGTTVTTSIPTNVRHFMTPQEVTVNQGDILQLYGSGPSNAASIAVIEMNFRTSNRDLMYKNIGVLLDPQNATYPFITLSNSIV